MPSTYIKQVAVLQIAERFFDSVVLFALFETGVFTALFSGAKTFEEIQEDIGGHAETLRGTLEAAVALGVLSFQSERYAAHDAFRECLGQAGSRAYIGEWVAFLHTLARPLLQLGETIRTGHQFAALTEEMTGDNTPAKQMTAAMDAYARTRGIEIADNINFSQARRLLDLGCGPGTYSMAIVEKHPRLKATLLDLPGPIAKARSLAAARKMSDRLEFVAANAMEYVPMEPFDTILVSNVLHMIGPVGSVELLRRCYDMLSPGGRVIIQAQYLNDDRMSPRWPVLLNLVQIAATPHGRNHAIGETKDWMERVGFTNVHYVRFSLRNVCSCLIGERPGDAETREPTKGGRTSPMFVEQGGVA